MRSRSESGAGLGQLVMLAIVALVLVVGILIFLTQLDLIFPPWEAYWG